MKRVAVFGNAGGGKSTLSKRLATMTDLPLVILDLVKYRAGGVEVSDEEFKAAHDRLLRQDQWVIDGFGSLDTLWERLDRADTLVYVDLPLLRHYWWVTKRFLKGVVVPPESWPEKTPLWQGTLNSYTVVGLCHKKLTPKYRAYVDKARATKQVYHLRSVKQVKTFYKTVATQLTNKS